MPLSNDEVINIPVIDILNADIQIGEQLVNAVVQWGFVFIKAHGSGFTSDIINNMFQIVSLKASCFLSRHEKDKSPLTYIISLATSFNRPLKIRSVIRSRKMSGSIDFISLLPPPPPFSHQHIRAR